MRKRRVSKSGIGWALAAVVSGSLQWTAFPPLASSDGSAWLASVPLFVAARMLRPRRAAAFGLAWGLAFFLPALSWFLPLADNGGPLPIVLLGQVGLASWCSLFCAAALAALSRTRAAWRGDRERAVAAGMEAAAAAPDSVEEARAEAVVERIRRVNLRREAAFPFVAAALWAGAETLRARVGGGFAWYELGAAQVRALPIAQLAAVGGVPLVSAAVVLLSDAVAGVLVRVRDGLFRVPGATRRHLDLTLALLALLVAFCWGSARVRGLRAAHAGARRFLAVAAVDPELPCLFVSWDEAWREAYGRLAEATDAAASARPDVVVWPETSLWGVMPDAGLEEAMSRRVAAVGAPILAGGTLEPETPRAFPRGGAAPVFNACFLFAEDGVAGHYAKRHLVPFGEYVPLDERIPVLQRLVPSGVTCTPGDGPRLLRVAMRRGGEALLSPLICFEDTVPETARTAARGADALVSLSNDAWFAGSCEAQEHAREAAFRAIENGIPLLRSSNCGLLGVVLPTGETAPETDGAWMVATVPLPERVPTPYSRLGDFAFGLPCAAALLGVLLGPPLARRIRRRREGGLGNPLRSC